MHCQAPPPPGGAYLCGIYVGAGFDTDTLGVGPTLQECTHAHTLSYSTVQYMHVQ